MNILTDALAAVQALYQEYPARFVAVVVAVVVFVATKAGVVVDQQSLTDALLYALPILLGGQLVHSKVTPVE